jgi:cation diffusion facilitator CzcD-associated flavoprotein CzcO
MVQPIKRVAVIGAGVSGVTAAAHLKAANIQVTLFERTNTSGGVWYLLNHVFLNKYTDRKPGFLIREFHRSRLIPRLLRR